MSRRVLTVILAGLALAWAACDSAVDPFTAGAQTRFVVHGFLSANTDTQVVRVQALMQRADAQAASLDGVSVRSTGDGERIWEAVASTGDDGEPVTLFRSAFRPLPGTSYELFVERMGETGAHAASVMPDVPTVIRSPFILGYESALVTTVTLVQGAPGLSSLAVWYDVVNPADGQPVRVSVPYGLNNDALDPNFGFRVFLSRDRAEVLRRLRLDPDDRTVELLGTGARVERLSPEWSDQSPDPGMLAGHGFFASVGRYDVTWHLTESEVISIGFVDAQPGG